MKARGFTMIETIIVLVLVSIMAAVVMAALPSVYVFQAQGSASQLRADLNLTKSLSMGKNQDYRIVIGTSSYQIQNQSGTPIVHPGTNPSAILYPTGVTITPTGTIIFNSMGAPFNGSGVALTSVLTLTATQKGITHTVNIYPQTGLVE